MHQITPKPTLMSVQYSAADRLLLSRWVPDCRMKKTETELAPAVNIVRVITAARN